uniref:Jitterbug, isoform M n=1 Tax=Drosophila melanogaster TaxID=7227 RepID=A0A0B4KEX6_DROME|nr:jitterbug, isoform M [Drosophila melanogaster]AGB93670.1 jitterbug, isoform M [Drosophila melanogaster]|eukprot:NP_001261139.1 jitterbug, isoform M [Drosophila melanogaster]
MDVKDIKGAKVTHAGLLKHNSDGTTETQKITHAGLVARSPEGTAAKGMNIRGNEDLWVEIQANTFRNWVNEHLRETGMQVHDWATDFCDGTCLCALVENLQTRPLKPSWNRRPANQHHYLENATTALKSIEADHIKLVNIGNVDIVNGNIKLILGLIWSLIVRYQIGRSKFPPRKLMLAWLQAALPDCRITNLTTDWNSGVNLAALLDYCQPGLFPHWRSLDPSQSVRNCTQAMDLAQREFGVPKVLEPEYLASPWLDELSGMTYLSYFMKPGGPGYNATMRWVNTQVKDPVKNFTTDWNDGRVMCEIIKGLGGSAPAPEKLSTDPFHYENNIRKAVDAGARLGVQPILTAKDMANPEVEHLGIMAYAAHLQWVPPRPPLSDLVSVYLESTSGRVGEPTHFRIDVMSRDISLSSVRCHVVPPSGQPGQPVRLNAHGEGVFVPERYGMHEIVVEIGEDSLGGHFFRALPRLLQVAPPGMAPCALGSLVEVLVNATGAPKTEDILVTAVSPTGISHNCPLKKIDEGHSAIFKPDEAGIWEIAITYQGRHIQGGPFTCAVFDASGVSVHGLDGAMPLRAHTFEVDARGVGVSGELHVDIVHDKHSLVCSVEKIVENKYRVTFMPRQNGKYRVYIYFNGYDVKGSPFIMRVGTKGRSGKTRSSPLHDSKHRSESPSMHFVSTTNTRHNDYRNSSLSRHNTAERTNSYSPQYSPKLDTTDYHSSSSRYYKRESETRSSEVHTHSPLTIKTSNQYESSTRNITSSPRHASVSPVQRYSPNSAYITTATHRMGSPLTSPVSKNGYESSRTVEKSSTYKSTSNYVTDSNIRASPSLYGTAERLRRTGSPEPRIDHSSNVRVSSMKPASARRDSWDVINKTKHMLSHNSLESLANMTEKQLNTELQYNRPDLDHETHRNTQYNKFALHKQQQQQSDYRRDSPDDGERYKPSAITVKSHSNNTYTDKSGGYTKTVKESSEHVVTESNGHGPSPGYGYSSLSRFRPIDGNATGARAIRVQDIPNGSIGRPVEFEIDGSRAGSGNLEILVNGGRVTSSVRSLGGQRFIASFTPHEHGTHTVQITFNGETVPGSPWHAEIMSSPGLTALGESTRLVPANTPAVFEILPPPGQSLSKGECVATVLTPSKSKLNARVTHEAANGAARIEFVPTEVGTHVIDASINGTKIAGGPLIAKVYDSSLIQVTEVNGGVVGQACQFRVDASAAGEGQLEISINEGEVPNHVQVVGGGRCLVSFTPEQAKSHLIDIKFNGETVRGCPFVCAVADTSRVLLNLSNLELIPVNRPSSFHITVSGGGAAELAVSVRGPQGELPVRVTGDIHAGFTAEFTPTTVGGHSINVEYNGFAVQGTPFLAKSYDASKVVVGSVSRGTMGRPVQFTVDAGDAGEGNLEITISAKGQNIPTQVHPQGSARFSVSFVPTESCEHTINVSFNKMPVPGCPITVSISGGVAGPQVSLGGPGPVHQTNSFVINHNGGRLEDIEVNVEGPAGQSVPAQVHQSADGVFKAEFVPRVVGEHRVNVTVNGLPTAGSPYAAKVYDVSAIKVKNVSSGTVGKAVTFLVETSQAGPGNLEVTVNGGRVPTSAQAQGQHTYAISFTPREAESHTVELRFNSQDVPGSPFTCRVAAAARIQSPETMDKVSVGRLFEFVVESDTKPTVEVLGPARRSVPVKIDALGSSTLGYNVKFEPMEVGDHSVEVRLPGGGHVEGSPFLLKAYSAEKVIVTDIRAGVVNKSVSFGINASQAGAGNLEIIVAVNGKNVPNFVQSEGNARFKVNFKPTEAATHSLSVRFNGHPVPGSPFSCHIAAAAASPSMGLPRAMAMGECLKQAAVKMDNTFELEGFDGVEPQIFVTSPSGDNEHCQLSQHDGGSYSASFRPTTVGRHLISVTANDQHINGSPFSCNVFDVSRVSISGLEQQYGPANLGVPVTFSVDAAGAGEGTLELVVSTDSSTVKAEVVACARGLYDVTFVPQSTEPHYVNITFNEVAVDGSPFRVDIQQHTQHIQIGSLAAIDFPADDQIVEIFSPDQKSVPYSINRQTAEFRTHMTGNYTLRFIDRETRQHIGSRTLCVFDPTLVKITEVSEAFCHRPASIGVSLNEAGQGDLSALVRCGATEVPHTIRGPSKTGVYEIVYQPTRVAPHKISILFNEVPISLKPLEINVLPASAGKEISVSGLGLYQSRVGKTTSFAIDTVKRPAREFDVVVSGPGGQALPVRCYQTKNGHLQAEFTINKPGQCVIEVLHQSKPLPGSPFTCESFDSSKVSTQGVTKEPLALHSPNSFTVRTDNAGTAELEAFAISPSNQSIPVLISEQSDGVYNVEFVPSQPGNYKLTLMYGGETIPSSPLNFTASSSGVRNDARAAGHGLEVCHRNKEASFVVYCPIAPNVQIERLDEYGERIEPKIKALGNNEWRISYTILSVGKYEIRASCPNRGSLPGSPWHISCVESNKVTPVGGWGTLVDHDGRLILPARIIFDVENAGPGKLVCSIDGIEIPVDKLVDGKMCLNITGENLAAGEHDLDLTWSGLTITQCPRSAFVTGQQAADKVQLMGRGLAAAQAGEAAHFTIDASNAPAGRPEVILTSQDNTSLPVSLAQPRPSENIWLASYTPLKSTTGTLNLSVKWNGRLVKGCPLTVAVGSSMDASKVIVSGEGLRHGIVGKDIKSWIDTRRAGPGELTAHCAGVRKVAYCELYDHGDATFTLNIKPQESGRHILTIKYGGQNVPGSPFALKVAGAPDASKVRVYGPGIEHGVLATFQSRFICDTRGAGAGQLTVRVRGPKGAFRVEMQRESQKDRTILCKYDPTEPGDYRVEVKWAGEFVPGSPFPVMIFDTEEELRRYLQGI